jgi:hypothetical protein
LEIARALGRVRGLEVRRACIARLSGSQGRLPLRNVVHSSSASCDTGFDERRPEAPVLELEGLDELDAQAPSTIARALRVGILVRLIGRYLSHWGARRGASSAMTASYL